MGLPLPKLLTYLHTQRYYPNPNYFWKDRQLNPKWDRRLTLRKTYVIVFSIILPVKYGRFQPSSSPFFLEKKGNKDEQETTSVTKITHTTTVTLPATLSSPGLRYATINLHFYRLHQKTPVLLLIH